jgi:uncharacterized protein
LASQKGAQAVMDFEWDPKKAATNEKKHKVSFQEGVTVFGDPLAYTFPDPDHAEKEHRFLTFGMSNNHRLLVVAQTDRNNKTRVINARLMTKHERKIYEES